MKLMIAIPLDGDRISQRFDLAEQFGLYECARAEHSPAKRLSLGAVNPLEKANSLAAHGIDILLCGGITGFIERLLQANNIRVIPWQKGNAEEVLTAFLHRCGAEDAGGGMRRRRRDGTCCPRVGAARKMKGGD